MELDDLGLVHREWAQVTVEQPGVGSAPSALSPLGPPAVVLGP